MTRREARDLGREPGFVLRYANTSTRTVYLADYRLNIGHATHDLDEAEWFASLIEATDNVHRIRVQAHYNCEAMAEPGIDRPRCCKAERLCEPCQKVGADPAEDLAHQIGVELVANNGAGGIAGSCPKCGSVKLRPLRHVAGCLDCEARIPFCEVVAVTAPSDPDDYREPLLTAEDALHNAALHFLEEAGDDDEIARAIVGEAQRTAWGTIHIGEAS